MDANNPWGSKKDKDPKDSIRCSSEKIKCKLKDIEKFISFDFNKNYFLIIILCIIFAWLSTGFYIVRPSQEGIELRFGRYVGTTTPGLHYHIPSPIENVFLVDVTTVNHEEIGYRSSVAIKSAEDFVQESLMLTGDENIVDINFEVQWRIKDARNYLFNVLDGVPGMTVQAAAESAMREVVGKNKIFYIIEGTGRAAISIETKNILQRTLDNYKMGVEIISLQMKKADPPLRVIDSFRDVQTARADKERIINQAYAYRNEVIPKIRGDAGQIINEAHAYKYSVVNQAIGETERFAKLYDQYKNNKFVTKKRIYLETIEGIFTDKDKVFVGNKNLLPFLSVTEITKDMR